MSIFRNALKQGSHMNAVRDHYTPGMSPDWGAGANRFKPVTYRTQTTRRLEARVAPTISPRWLSTRQLEDLKARWFALGSLATTAVLAVGYGLVQLMGVLS